MHKILYNKHIKSDDFPLEMIERKGIWHPDTLADLIAETFSNKYAYYCLKKFGVLLNYWVDKITLTGGEAIVEYGRSSVVKPIWAYLFGKVTVKVWKEIIDAEKIFKESVEEVLGTIFWKEILEKIDFHVNINQGVGMDFDKDFYKPSFIDAFAKNVDNLKSNDTVVCSWYWPYTFTEKLTIYLENYICGKGFKRIFSSTWRDVKVLIARIWDYYDITTCIPFIASKTPNFTFYFQEKQKIQIYLTKVLNRFFKMHKIQPNCKLSINTKDNWEFWYVTVFGTALDKWDFWAVGRGNKYSWVISSNRDTNIEAVCGKSAFRHGWKIYTILSYGLAQKIGKMIGADVIVTVCSQNGRLLSDPMHVFVSTSVKIKNQVEILQIVEKYIQNIPKLPYKIIALNPINEHRNRTVIL